VAVGLLGLAAVMAKAQGSKETVEEFRLPDSLRGIAWMAYRYTRSACYGTSLLHGLFPLFEGRERLSLALAQSQGDFMMRVGSDDCVEMGSCEWNSFLGGHGGPPLHYL
jgi:hypothetical protein